MLIHHVVGRPWAVTPEIAEQVRAILQAEGFAGLRQLSEFHKELKAHAQARTIATGGNRGGGGVLVIPVFGFLTHRGGVVESAPTTSTAALAEATRAAAADPKIDAIVHEHDSPGGEVYGVTEAAAAIREARRFKPVVSAINTHSGSADYWLASQADEVIITPSGELGSIGVYGAHEDKSEELKAQGRKITLVSAGKYKVERAPFGPLSTEAVAAMQADVDRYYGQFVSDVAKARRVSVDAVRNGFGEGRMVGAKAAVEQGMATAVGTIDDAIRRAAQLGAEKRRGMSALAAAHSDRLKLD